MVQVSGGQMDDQLKEQFTEITSVILSNQTEALANLTKKVEREIGQVWRQMGKDTFSDKGCSISEFFCLLWLKFSQKRCQNTIYLKREDDQESFRIVNWHLCCGIWAKV